LRDAGSTRLVVAVTTNARKEKRGPRISRYPISAKESQSLHVNCDINNCFIELRRFQISLLKEGDVIYRPSFPSFFAGAACQFNFMQLGRFSSMYARQFGERHSQTLTKSLGQKYAYTDADIGCLI